MNLLNFQNPFTNNTFNNIPTPTVPERSPSQHRQSHILQQQFDEDYADPITYSFDRPMFQSQIGTTSNKKSKAPRDNSSKKK